MTLGQRIRDRRRTLGLTLKQVADSTEISIPYLSDIERDKAQPPSLKMLAQIAETLGMTTQALLEDVEELKGAETEMIVLPPGLRELKDHPFFGPSIDEQWLRTLLSVDYRGKRPETMKDWLLLYQTLQTIYEDKKP